MIPIRVLNDWLDCPFDPVPPTNGQTMLFRAWHSTTRPIVWISSLAAAAVVGYEFSSSGSAQGIDSDVSNLIQIALNCALFALAFQVIEGVITCRRVIRKRSRKGKSQLEFERREAELGVLKLMMGRKLRGQFGTNSASSWCKFLIALLCLGITRLTR
jgi:hypothetical protein